MADGPGADVSAMVTVVIAAYNQRWCLDEAVRSVLIDQGAVRCVIAVDACPFGTAEVAARLANSAPGVVKAVELSKNLGQAGARDVGLRFVDTPWVLFLDGDDVLLPGGIPDLLAAAQHAEEPDAVLGRFERVDAERRPIPVDRRTATIGSHVVLRGGSPHSATLEIESFLTDFRIAPPGAWLLRTAFVRSLHGFDPAMRSNEDLEFMVRVLEAGTVVEIDRVVLSKRMHQTQQTDDALLQRRTHLKALWRSLRRSRGSSRALVIRGATSCFLLRSRATLSYGTTLRQAPKAAVWRLLASSVSVAGALDRLLRVIVGPMPPPEEPSVDARSLGG